MTEELNEQSFLKKTRNWTQKDFSWTGLSKQDWIGWAITELGECIKVPFDNGKPVIPSGATQASLQDYWRELEDKLILSPDGKRHFTPVHLPLEWEDGSSTEKLRMSSRGLKSIISQKLKLSERSDIGPYIGDPKSSDGRAQFQGVFFCSSMLQALQDGGVIFAIFDYAIFCEEFGQINQFAHGVSFRETRFLGEN